MSKNRYLTHNICLRCASLGIGCCSLCHPFVLSADLAPLLKKYSAEKVIEIVEVSEIPSMYMEHLSDPDMAQIYYLWNSSHYRLQMRFLNGLCTALKPGKGCTLEESRPLICRVWPYWWKEGTQPSTENFPLEISGECTMVTLWNFPAERVLKELGLSEDEIRKELISMNKALNEHRELLEEAREENIPAPKLLEWFINRVRREGVIRQ